MTKMAKNKRKSKKKTIIERIQKFENFAKNAKMLKNTKIAKREPKIVTKMAQKDKENAKKMATFLSIKRRMRNVSFITVLELVTCQTECSGGFFSAIYLSARGRGYR